MSRALAALTLAALPVLAAHAAPDPIRALRVECTAAGVEPAELRAALAVELVRAQTSTTPVEVRLDPRPCPSATFELELVGTSSTHRSAVSVADVPVEARARAIAIILRERIAHPREQEHAATAPAVADAVVVPSTVVPVEPSPAAPRPGPALFTAVAVRHLERYGQVLLGAQAGARLHATDGLRAELGLAAFHGTTTHPLGEGRLLLAALSGSLSIETTVGPVVLSAGPRLEAGLALQWARATSTAVDAHDGVAPVLALGAVGSAGLRVSDAVEAYLALDGAAVLRGTDGLARGEAIMGVAGWMSGAALGVRLGL